MADELAKVITKIIWPTLKAEGFLRIGRRGFTRVENGIAQSILFHLMSWGGRDFCVEVYANIIAGNEHVALQPGFRLSHGAANSQWLPSLTAEEAKQSAQVTLEAIKSRALPYFEKIRTVGGFYKLLPQENWASVHHLNFQCGIADALDGNASGAQRHLEKAIRLYQEDGREWCFDWIERARTLQMALVAGTADQLLTDWEQANSKAHGL